MAKSSRTPAYPSTYPQGGTFGQLLDWHLNWGTRPGCNVREKNTPWVRSKFAQFIHEVGFIPKSAAKSLRNWTNHGVIPEEKDTDKVEKIFVELFGTSRNLRHWKSDLRQALDDGRKAQESRIAKRTLNEPPSPPQNNAVPCPTPYFMGRDEDVATLAAAIVGPAGPNAILVQGGPGMGKTELTKVVAHHERVVERFGDRRWFVSLETAATAVAMQAAIATAIGCDSQYGFQAALGILREKPALLILDNLETPWEPIAEREATEETLAELAAIPGVALLASVRGQEWMKQPKWFPHPLSVLTPKDAAEMFASIGGPWVHEDPVLDDFLLALGGLPLAIELVARRAYGRADLAPLWAEWNRIGAELARHPDFADGRLTSLPHSIELSLQSSRTTTPALRLFSLLGCLPAGLAVQDLISLMADDAFMAEERLLALGLAVEWPGHITLLPPIRDYARRYYLPSVADTKKIAFHFMNVIKTRMPSDGEKWFADNGQIDRYYASNSENFKFAFRCMMHHDMSQIFTDALESSFHALHVLDRNVYLFDEIYDFLVENVDYKSAYKISHIGAAFSEREFDYGRAIEDFHKARSMAKMLGDAASGIACLISITRNELMLASDGNNPSFPADMAAPIFAHRRAAHEAVSEAEALSAQIDDVYWKAYSKKTRAEYEFVCGDKSLSADLNHEAALMFKSIGSDDEYAMCLRDGKDGLANLYMSDFPVFPARSSQPSRVAYQ